MLKVIVAAIFALTLIGVAPLEARAQATVTAGGQSCLNWTYAENRQGNRARPQITFVNRCNRAVAGYICTTTVFSGGQGCNRPTASYWNRVFAANETHLMSTSSGGTQSVIIRECPSGYARIPNGNVSNYPCAR